MRTRPTLPARIVEQRALVGLLQGHPDPVLTELAAVCGYDFLLFDGEHGLFGESDYLHALQTLAASRTLGLVRVASHDPHTIGRYMDMGADAIVVPNVSTAEQARALVRAMHYPPTGVCGVGASLHRATRYGIDIAAYLKAPRDMVSLLPIIESSQGAANAEEILAVEGVDGVIVGPADLAADLGCSGDLAHPAFAKAVTSIERAAASQGKILGTAPYAGNPIEALVARGHRMLIIGSDISVVREAMLAQIAKSKAALASLPSNSK